MPHQLSKEELRLNKIKRKEFLQKERNEIYILLDSLKSAHNVGTILRLADSLLIKKVYICGNTIVPPNKKIKTSSRGTERWVPWEYCEDPVTIVKELKYNGVEIISIELADNSIDYREYSPNSPVCLILGREYDGVSQDLLNLSDYIIHLPSLGMTNSINVSTAASVIMFDVYDKLEKIKQKNCKM